MKQQLKRLSVEQQKTIKDNILKGVVSRASTLLFLWAFVVGVYGLLSLDLFHTVLPNLSLWENLWPRLLYNSTPILIFAFWYKRYEKNTKLKAYSTIVMLPLFLVSASMVYAWPIIFGGNYKFYFNFHATNIIAFSSGLSVISGSPAIVIWQFFGFLIIYFGPLLYLFLSKDPLMFNLILSDISMISIILFFGLRVTYRLRFFLAGEDLLRKSAAATFLGDSLTKAIYETKDMKFSGYSQEGLIMAIDLRGYTNFIQTAPSETAKSFMSKLHSIVTRLITTHGGYLHKTSGDGFLISFGIMEKEPDLSDVPGIEEEEILASTGKKMSSYKRAFKTFNELTESIDELLSEIRVSVPLVIGCGLSYGKVDVVLRGDEKYRQELDIDGSSIIKAVRLESYSKLFNNLIDKESSFLILEPIAFDFDYKKFGLKMWLIESKEHQIRDFPDITSVLYSQRTPILVLE